MRSTAQPKFRRAPVPDDLGKWLDVTGYSRDKPRIPSAWTLKITHEVRVTVTNSHIYYPEKWVVHCDPWFNTRPLDASSEEQAKRMALDLVAQKIDGLGAALKTLLDN